MSWRRVAALEFIEELCRDGLRVDASRAKWELYVWPRQRITAEHEKMIRSLKPHLVEILDPEPPEGPCPDCGAVNYVRPAGGHWRCLACRPLSAADAAEMFFGPVRWVHEREVSA